MMDFLNRLTPGYWIARIQYGLSLRELTQHIENLRGVLNSGNSNSIEQYLAETIRFGKKAIQQSSIIPDSKNKKNLESMLGDIITIQLSLYQPLPIQKSPFAKYNPN